ncbi:TPA: hypothetical protein ROY23_000483 [Bacillus wiedmannii]|nr:hypothetical protein [Bacillus wiedmannii]
MRKLISAKITKVSNNGNEIDIEVTLSDDMDKYGNQNVRKVNLRKTEKDTILVRTGYFKRFLKEIFAMLQNDPDFQSFRPLRLRCIFL